MQNGKEFLEAAKSGDRATMEALLQTQPELLAYNGKGISLGLIGHSALHWAAAKGQDVLVQWLIGQGANMEQRNSAESTALHTAAQNGNRGVMEILLTAGADPAAVDAEGQTARDVALERNHPELAKLLEKSAGIAAARDILRKLAGAESWGIADMKTALRLSGVDVSGIMEKNELVKLTTDLLQHLPPAAPKPVLPPVATAAPEATPSSAMPAAASPKTGETAAPADGSSDEEDDAISKGAERAKQQGNDAFARGAYEEAVKHFSLAVRLDPKNHVLYSNRSAARASLGRPQESQ